MQPSLVEMSSRMSATPLPSEASSSRSATPTAPRTRPRAPSPLQHMNVANRPQTQGSFRHPLSPPPGGSLMTAQRSPSPTQSLTRNQAQVTSSDLRMVISLQQDCLQSIKRLESTCSAIQREQSTVSRAVKELQDMMEGVKKSFSFKGSGYETPLRKEMAILFCTSLSRYPDKDNVHHSIKKVLSRADLEKYIVEACLKECNAFLSVFRTEERRRVLGCKPLQSVCHLPTTGVVHNIMEYLKAPDDVKEVYTKHMALLRKFIRDTPGCAQVKNSHSHYKNWLADSFPEEVSEEDWTSIMDWDDQHPYNSHPLVNIDDSYCEEVGEFSGDVANTSDITATMPVNPNVYIFPEFEGQSEDQL